MTLTKIESFRDGIKCVYTLAITGESKNIVVIRIPTQRFYEALWN